MESVGSRDVSEYFLIKKAMDMQIGALNVEKSVLKHKKPYKSTMQSSGLRHLDPDTNFKVRGIVSKVNEAIFIAANEPSLGMFRIQEHVYRTLPQLIQRKKELQNNLKKIDDAAYDLNLSVEVIDSVSKIKNFTRIQEALKTAIEMKRHLNLAEEEAKARIEIEAKHAREANKSISLNEPAEGYICPVCYFALTNQDDLISHWQKEHSLDKYDNEVFHEVELPCGETQTDGSVIAMDQDHDMTVIEIPKHVSECEDVVRSFDRLGLMDKHEEITTDRSENIVGDFDELEVTDKPEEVTTDRSENVVGSFDELEVTDKPEEVPTDRSENIVGDFDELEVTDKPEEVTTDRSENVVGSFDELEVTDKHEEITSNRSEIAVGSFDELEVKDKHEEITTARSENDVTSVDMVTNSDNIQTDSVVTSNETM